MCIRDRLLTDWYDEQVLEWKKRLDGLKNDYMIESVPVIDTEDNVDWGDYVRPVIYDITDWGFLVVPDENHLVENDIKGLEHIIYTTEYYLSLIHISICFAKASTLRLRVPSMSSSSRAVCSFFSLKRFLNSSKASL